MEKSIKYIIITAIVGFVFGFLAYGYAFRPIVDYTLDSPESFDTRWDTTLTVRMEMRNRGQTDAPLLLILRVQNVTISPSEEEPWTEYTGSEIKIYTIALKKSEKYRGFSIDILVEGKPQSFTISYYIERRFKASVSGIVSFLFCEFNRYYPTSVTYVEDDTGRYTIRE